ncbi:MAG: rhomboid family intramembrane serine protease [Nocardioidaceae bacterium]
MTDPTPPDTVPVCYRHPGKETYISCQRCGKPICPDCMRSAAVGFQCPDCVKEGAKSTRSGRTPYGGEISRHPARTTQVLIGVNAAVWLLILATGAADSLWVGRLALVPDTTCVQGNALGCTQVVDGVANGDWWQLVTSMFAHVQVWHIGFNMLALWVLGPQLELFLGRTRYLAVYLLSGLAGSVCVYWFESPNSLTLGASGALFGVMGALAVIALKLHGNVSGLLTWIAINFAFTFMPGMNISWQGHLGGFAGGCLLAALIVYAPRQLRAPVQIGGLAAFTLVLLGLIVARTLALA